MLAITGSVGAHQKASATVRLSDFLKWLARAKQTIIIRTRNAAPAMIEECCTRDDYVLHWNNGS
jgi:hypothetical protein